jgi:hypothetical protein
MSAPRFCAAGTTVLVLMLAAVRGFAQVETSSTTFESVRLPLGISLDSTKRLLGSQYSLTSAQGHGETFGVWTNRSPPPELLGTLSFHNGHLAAITREWFISENSSTAEVADAFVRALDQLLHGGSQQCVVRTKRQEDPSLESREVDVSCGSRTIRLSSARFQGGKSQVSVTEVLPRRE